MTPNSGPEQRSPEVTAPQIGLLGGRWQPHHRLCLPIDDVGFRQGATAVERLRTYASRVFQLSAHLDRWQHTIDELGIVGLPLRQAIEVLIRELLARNQSFIDSAGDVGITMFATPGTASSESPTFCMHLNSIDHALHRRRREQGQALVVTRYCQPLASSWPRSIKVRCRLHYFLADQLAAGQHPGALAVLSDQEGNITETSIANLAIVESGNIIAPPRDDVLGGITQQVVESLADQASIRWSQSTISAERFAAADEVLLMGTDGGLWFANGVWQTESPAANPVTARQPGNVYRRLLAKFDDLTGC